MRLLPLVIEDLREGYGIEDMAVRHGFTADEIRSVVAGLRDRGVLDRHVNEMRRRMTIRRKALERGRK